MKCDMCGKTDTLYKTIIEDAQLSVCSDCSRFGKVIGKIAPQAETSYSSRKKTEKPEVMHLVVDNYATLIKNKREKLKLTQEQFAHKINEKTSTIHQLESAHMKPSAQLANKLKKAYGLILIEEYKEKNEHEIEETDMGEYTLGDFIKIKKKT